MAAGQDRAKNLPEPYCVIVIPLGWERDGTGEVEECCLTAALAKTRDEEVPSILGFARCRFGVAQEERLAARLATEREGQPGRVEGGGHEEDASQLSCRHSVVAAVSAAGVGEGGKQDRGRSETGAKMPSGPQGGVVEGDLVGLRH